MNKKRILIFASGRGSNAEAIHEAVMDGRINGEGRTGPGKGSPLACAFRSDGKEGLSG